MKSYLHSSLLPVSDCKQPNTTRTITHSLVITFTTNAKLFTLMPPVPGLMPQKRLLEITSLMPQKRLLEITRDY